MIELQLVPNKKSNRKPIKFSLPTGWRDVSLRMWLALRRWESDESQNGAEKTARLMEVFTGIGAAIWMQSDAQETDTVMSRLMWFVEPIDWEKLPIPDKISIKDKEITNIPQNLAFEAWGAKLTAEDKIATEVTAGNDPMFTMPYVLACYLQDRLDGEFDDDKIEGHIDDILDMSALDAVPLGFFFIVNSNVFRRSGVQGSTASPAWKSLRRVWKGLISSSTSRPLTN